jgi:hypothetical protein
MCGRVNDGAGEVGLMMVIGRVRVEQIRGTQGRNGLAKVEVNSCSEFSLTMGLPSTVRTPEARMYRYGTATHLRMHDHCMYYKPSLLIGFTMTILTLPLWVFGSFSILTSTVIASNTLTFTFFPFGVGIVME